MLNKFSALGYHKQWKLLCGRSDVMAVYKKSPVFSGILKKQELLINGIVKHHQWDKINRNMLLNGDYETWQVNPESVPQRLNYSPAVKYWRMICKKLLTFDPVFKINEENSLTYVRYSWFHRSCLFQMKYIEEYI